MGQFEKERREKQCIRKLKFSVSLTRDNWQDWHQTGDPRYRTLAREGVQDSRYWLKELRKARH